MEFYLSSCLLGRIFVGGWDDQDKGSRSEVKRSNFGSSLCDLEFYCDIFLFSNPVGL